MDNEVLIYGCILISTVSIVGLIINRIKMDKAFGIRSIQFAILTVLMPLIVILTIKSILPPSTIAVLVGVIIGYSFSNIGTKNLRNKN